VLREEGSMSGLERREGKEGGREGRQGGREGKVRT
jgi:hypothetical protein